MNSPEPGCDHWREALVLHTGTSEAAPDGLLEHLRECLPCRNRQAELTGTWNLLSEIPAAHDPPFFAERVGRKIRTQRLWRLLAPSAAAALLLAGLLQVTFDFVSPPAAEDVIAQLPAGDREIVENLDLLENYDLMRSMDLLAPEELSEEEE